jgi:catechol 2,3-dioxygenase-like lactoylglutathione lyase family enzyme
MNERELGAIAEAIIDSNGYLTLGTADESGMPWVSPVWYAAAGYHQFLWVSSPDARHSRNLAARPEVSIAIFDSRAPIGSGQGVYISATAGELTGAEREWGIGVFSRRSEAQGAPEWTLDDVRAPARRRLYRATAGEHWVLGAQDQRIPVSVSATGEAAEAHGATRGPTGPIPAAGGLERGAVATRLPAQDLERAQRFYAEKLGLEPVEARPGGLRYRCRAGEFALFQSSGAASGDHTQMAWEVEDIEATVRELRDRGLVFEEYDLPGLRTVDGIAEVEGNYPSKGGVGERAAWFRDSEGNVLGIGQRVG